MGTKMTEGRPLPILLRFALPLLMGNIFQQFYNMADTILVGKYVGSKALAAVGSTGTIMFLVLGICNGMVSGFTILTSQRYGASDENGTQQSVGTGIVLSALISVLLSALSVTAMRPLLHLMNTPDDIFEDACLYITIICMGTAATVFYNYFASSLRAIGNSRVPLVLLVFSTCLNIVLDLVFILVFKMGVAGAAWATVLSQAVAAISCLVYIIRKVPELTPHHRQWIPEASTVRAELRLGIPMSLQFGITASGTMVMQSAVNLFGSTAVAGYTAANKVQNLFTQGCMTMGQTMTAYAGQNYGKLALDRIREGARDAVKISIVYSIVAAALINLFLPSILRLFFAADTDLTTLLPWARIYIYESSVCFLPLFLIFIFRNTMQACGYGFTAMVCGIVEFLTRTVFALLSMHLVSYPLAVGCDPLAWVTGAITGVCMYHVMMHKLEQSPGRHFVRRREPAHT